jgi:peroxiredoxin
MKNRKPLYLFLFLFFSVSSICFSQVSSKTKTSFQLQLKIKDFGNGYLKLAGIYGDQNYGIDSVFADASGKAVFKLDSALPSGMYFIVFPDNSIVQFLVDKEQQFSLEFNKADVINTMKATGSIDNELFYKSLREEAVINAKMDSVQKLLSAAAKGSSDARLFESEITNLKEERKARIKWFADNHPNSFFAKFKLSGQNPDIPKPLKPDGSIDDALFVYNYRNDFWKAYDFSDARLLRTPVYFNKLKKYLIDITPQLPDSIIKYADWVSMQSKANKEVFKYTVNWIALHYKEAKILGRESVYVFMVERFWTPDQAFWAKDYEIQRLRMQAKEMKVSLIGQTGHDIKGINENGQAVSLYDSKAPVHIVYMFSYDCENCKRETPKMAKLYNEWKDKGLDLFTICIDGDADKWKAYLQKNGLVDRNIFDPGNESNFRAHYYFEVTPGIFVLDKNHKIIATNVGAESLPLVLAKELEAK